MSWDNSRKGYNSQQDRAYYQNMISPALSNCNASGDKSQVILKDNISQIVRVRKHIVNIEKLKTILKENKHISNKEISEKLEVPITTVEHWFRKDSCFSIPKPNIWFNLKELLNISTDEFDNSIIEFQEREGIFEKANRVYREEGISPTITSTSGDEKISNELRIRKLTPKECWRLMGFDDKDFDKASKVNSNTQLYKQAGNSIVVNVLEAIFKNLVEKGE